MKATATPVPPNLGANQEGGDGERDPVSHEIPPTKLSRHQAAQPDANDTACTPVQRRRAASYRCAPLVCGRRDPLDPLGTRGPSTFGLTSDELRAEANRLAELGWALDEVTARLAVALRREVAT